MVITKDRIWAQIQQDSAAYDAFSDELKEVLLKEVELVQGSYPDRGSEIEMPHMMTRARTS